MTASIEVFVWLLSWLIVCDTSATELKASQATTPEATSKPESTAKTRIVLVGDSTVTDPSGWGLGFARLLKPNAECINKARGGQSSKSFYDKGNWKLALAEKPDYVLIQFGHNDQPGKGPDRETDPKTTYREYLGRYVDEARAAGAEPILVTSLTRRTWGPDGKIRSSLVPYVEAMKAVAQEKKVPLVDLHAASIALVEKLGQEKAKELGPPHPKDPKLVDGTHLSASGADIIASLVAEELRKVVPALRESLREADAKPQVVWNVDNLKSIGGHDVVVVGEPKVVEIDGVKGVEFDGKDDGLFVAANPLAGLTKFTVEVVFRPAAGGPAAQRFLHFQPDGAEDRLLFETRLTPESRWFLDTYLLCGKTNQTLFAEKFPHPLDKWHTATITIDGEMMRHYVDGKEELSAKIQPAVLGKGRTSIGVRFNKVHWYQGTISRIRVTPEVLHPADFLKP